MPSLADRTIETASCGTASGSGSGRSRHSPSWSRRPAMAGGATVFIVTDPGVVASGVIDAVRAVLEAAGMHGRRLCRGRTEPGPASIAARQRRPRGVRARGTVVVPVGGGSSMDSAKAISLHAANGGDVLAMGYHREDLTAGRPVDRRPDDRRDGCRMPHASVSSRTKWPGARTTSATRPCCPSGRSWTRP